MPVYNLHYYGHDSRYKNIPFDTAEEATQVLDTLKTKADVAKKFDVIERVVNEVSVMSKDPDCDWVTNVICRKKY